MKLCLTCNKPNFRPRSKFCSQACACSGYLKVCKQCNKNFRGVKKAIFCSGKCFYKSSHFQGKGLKPPEKNHLCKWCNEVKIYHNFREVNKNLHLGFKKKGGWTDIEGKKRYSYCKKCESDRQKRKRDERPAHRLFLLAKRRAKREGLIFDITTEYLESIWPKDNKCPILKTEFLSGMKNKYQLPTLDKVVPKKGYTKGNVAIISFKANNIKSDIDDFEIFKRIYDYTRKFN